MASINIQKAEIFVVELPMTKPFTVSFGTVSSRRLVLVKLTDKEGAIGWGEASTLDEPLFKPDYLGSVVAVLKEIICPALLQHEAFASPEELDDHLSFVRGHYFAKAAISIAAYDIAAQKANKTLAAYIGAARTQIEQSETISITKSPSEMLDCAAELIELGFQNIKLKIGPNADLLFAQALRDKYPDLPLMVDANAAYRFSDETVKLFQAFDELKFFSIEQPLDWNDIYDHARLQKLIKTPVALDESVDCLHDFEQALALKSCRLLNIKVSRVGGFTAALRLYELGRKNNIGLWVGGMLEGPVGLAAVIAFSALEGLTLPADYISSHYLIENLESYFDKTPYKISSGNLTPNFTENGLGFAINYERLCAKATCHIKI